jgi:hypothetical protein
MFAVILVRCIECDGGGPNPLVTIEQTYATKADAESYIDSLDYYGTSKAYEILEFPGQP